MTNHFSNFKWLHHHHQGRCALEKDSYSAFVNQKIVNFKYSHFKF